MINILLIDDNLGFIEVFKEMLLESSMQFNLVEASNPIEGLEKLARHNYNFHFIICDFFLPIQNGTDLLDIVKAHNKAIICLLISGDEVQKAKHAPCVDGFFSKFDTHEVIEFLKANSEKQAFKMIG